MRRVGTRAAGVINDDAAVNREDETDSGDMVGRLQKPQRPIEEIGLMHRNERLVTHA